MIHLFMLTQHSVKARFAGNIDSLIGQPRHDLGRRQALVLRTIAYGQYPFPFLLGERLVAGFACRTLTPVSEGFSTAPAAQRPVRDAQHTADRTSTRLNSSPSCASLIPS